MRKLFGEIHSLGTVAVVLLLLAVAAVANAPARRTESRLTVVIGDLHGDARQARLLLRKAHIIDDADQWIANTTTLIQTGDLMDKGAEESELLEFFMALQMRAHAAGGAVVVLLGNHEAYNLRGDFEMVARPVIKQQGGSRRRRQLLSATAPLGTFLRSLPLLHTQDGVLFAHGGVSKEIVKDYCQDLSHVNEAARLALGGHASSRFSVSSKCLSFIRQVLSEDERSPRATAQNPLFMRLLPSGSGSVPATQCEIIQDALGAVSADGSDGTVDVLIAAHTPHRNWKRRYCIAKKGSNAFPQFIEIDYHLSRWKRGTLGAGAVVVIRTEYDGPGSLVKREISMHHFSPGTTDGPDAALVLQKALTAPLRVVNTPPVLADGGATHAQRSPGGARTIAEGILVAKADLHGMSRSVEWLLVATLVALVGSMSFVACRRCIGRHYRGASAFAGSDSSKLTPAGAANIAKINYGTVDT